MPEIALAIYLSLFAVAFGWRMWLQSRRTGGTGLFSLMRNPIYTGSFLAIAGVFLMVPNALSAAALVLILPGLEIQVRQVEEPYLLQTHGDTYRAYARRVGRFIPWVGRLA